MEEVGYCDVIYRLLQLKKLVGTPCVNITSIFKAAFLFKSVSEAFGGYSLGLNF
jgi:hypothetical protein